MTAKTIIFFYFAFTCVTNMESTVAFYFVFETSTFIWAALVAIFTTTFYISLTTRQFWPEGSTQQCTKTTVYFMSLDWGPGTMFNLNPSISFVQNSFTHTSFERIIWLWDHSPWEVSASHRPLSILVIGTGTVSLTEIVPNSVHNLLDNPSACINWDFLTLPQIFS